MKEFTPVSHALVETTLETPRTKSGQVAWGQLVNEPLRLIATIEAEAEAFATAGNHFNQRELRHAGMHGLLKVIAFHYPGGMYGLREKLGLKSPIRPKNFWTLERIEQECRRVYEEEGKLTQKVLRELGLQTVARLVSSDHGGGINELKRKIGIPRYKISRKEYSIEGIEKEAREFCENHETITQKLLEAEGKANLWRAICLYYPGRIKGLKRELGIAPVKRMREARKIDTKLIPEERFLVKFPEFNGIFPRDEAGRIIDSKLEEAKSFILGKLRTKGHFESVFGEKFLEQHPQFNNSYVSAIRDIFGEWGMRFKTTDFYESRLWKYRSEQEVIERVRLIFLEEFPEFKNNFLGEDGLIFADKLQEAKTFILKRISPRVNFERIFGRVKLSGHEFARSRAKVIRHAFADIGINFQTRDFTKFSREQINWKNKAEDEVSEIALTLFLEQYPEFQGLLEKFQSNEADSGELKEFILYRIGSNIKFRAIMGNLDYRKNVPQFEGSYKIAMRKIFSRLGIQFDAEDFKREPLWNEEKIEREFIKIANEYGYVNQSLLRNIKRVDLQGAIQGIYPGGWSELRRKTKVKSSLPGYWTVTKNIEEEATEFFGGTKPKNQEWVRLNHPKLCNAIRTHYPGGFEGLLNKLGLAEPEWTIERIEQEAQGFFKEYGSLTDKTLRQNGRGPFSVIITKKYPEGLNGLKTKLGIEYYSQLNRGKPRRRGFPKPEGYWTAERIQDEARVFISEVGDISFPKLNNHNRSDLASAIVTKYPGKMNGLRENLGLKKKRIERDEWTIERIEDEARQFFESYGGLTLRLCIKHKRTPLYGAIVKIYPGGLYVLKANIGIERSRVPRGYWTQETIEKEAQEFYEEFGNLTKTLLVTQGRDDIASAISVKYPGKMSALKVALGIKLDKRNPNTWNEELIEREALEFFIDFGRLTFTELVRQKRLDLKSAINLYPGGISALREKLGFVPEGRERQLLSAYEQTLALGQQISFEEFVRQEV